MKESLANKTNIKEKARRSDKMKNYQYSIGVSLPKEFVDLIDKIVKENPDFKNRTAVIRYAVRRYYDELLQFKKNR